MTCDRCIDVSDALLDSAREINGTATGDLFTAIKILQRHEWKETVFTKTEIVVVAELLASRPEVTMRNTLIQKLNAITGNNVRVVISRVRRKLPVGWDIVTFPGYGWRLISPDEDYTGADGGHFLSHQNRLQVRAEPPPKTLAEIMGMSHE